MEILKGFFDDLQSNPEYLNRTKSKSIQVCFDPEKLPNMVPSFKLNSHDHRCHIIFSKETMNAITQKFNEIRCGLRDEEEKMLILNDELKVFSERMHNQYAVCFLNFQGVRIDIMIDSFRKMVEISQSTFTKYAEIEQKLQKSAKNLKEFLDALLAKYNQCNVNNPEYQGFLQQLHQCVSSFGEGGSTTSHPSHENNVVDLMDSNDDDENEEEEDEFEDEEEYDSYDEYHHHRYGYGRRYNYW